MASDENVPSNDNASKVLDAQHESPALSEREALHAWNDNEVRLRAHQSLRNTLERLRAWLQWAELVPATYGSEEPHMERDVKRAAEAMNLTIDGFRFERADERDVDQRDSVLFNLVYHAAAARECEQEPGELVRELLEYVCSVSPVLAERLEQAPDQVRVAVAKLLLPVGAIDSAGALEHNRALFVLTKVLAGEACDEDKNARNQCVRLFESRMSKCLGMPWKMTDPTKTGR